MERDLWELANEYLGVFAVECHFRPDDVYDMGWVPLVRLTLFLDDLMDDRRRTNNQASQAGRESSLRRMA